MKEIIITKSELDKLLEDILKKHKLVAPVNVDNLILFQNVDSIDRIVFDYANTVKPVKELFFPQRETLFTYSGSQTVMAEVQSASSVIFGVRPCDIRSLLILDKAFDGDYKDPYYIEKRKNTVLLGLSCEEPEPSCYCTSFNSGPHSGEGMDALFTKLSNNRYYVEIFTEKAEQIFQKHNIPADVNSKNEKQSHKELSEKKIKSHITVPDLDRILQNEYWDKVSQKCITCGICRFLCATCYCFSLADEKKERVKFWAACTFPSFTKEAAGSNPREKKVDRYKQWYYHKFSNHKKNYDEHLCSGCGRCIRMCPVKINFTEVIKNAESVYS
ncbi:MAG: 4Fe-4S dicluster domain-containing protein [Elusimicrobiota bacterium]